MSTNPNYRRYPSSWGPVVAVLLALGGMAFLIFGSWALGKAAVTDGIILSALGVICIVAFGVLFFAKGKVLFPSS